MAVSSSELALTTKYPPVPYSGLRDLKKRISIKYEALSRDGKSQHLSFKLVRPEDFDWIESKRDTLGCAVRFTYFGDIETLIVKIPSRAHERAHTNFAACLSFEVFHMGIFIEEFTAQGATKYAGDHRSSKECDSSWTNDTLRPGGGWPFLVVEAGVSESMPRLRADANWWVSNSRGEVKIVLLIRVTTATRHIEIEKRISRVVTRPNTRQRTQNPSAVYEAYRTATILINHGDNPPTIHGAPLVLEFEKVFGRAPSSDREHDIVLTAEALLRWAQVVFN